MPNKYPQDPEAELDLHHCTRDEARDAVLPFLEDAHARGLKRVRVIVGKGLHSADGPVLGQYVRSLLDEYEYEYHDAKITRGAHGAIEVKLQ